jgi:hypothetical protein
MLATLVLAVVVQSPSVASTPRDPGLERGVVLVEKGDAAAAVAELDGAVRRLSAERRFNELARAHLYLGAAYVVLGQDRAARASFKEALRWSEVRFAKGRMPPMVIDVFAEVLKDTGRAGGAPPEPEAGVWYEAPSTGCCLEVFLPPGTRQVVVDAKGAGDFRSLAAAIRSEPSVRILVRPGIYRESLRLDRPVALIGEGPREAIVIESEGAPALAMSTPFALVEGVTIRARPAGSASPFAVEVAQGQLVLRGCDLSSEALSVVTAHDAGTAVLENCLVHDTRDAGVFAFAGGRATVQGGVVRGCRLGADVRGGTLEMSQTRVERSTGIGILLEAGSRATLDAVDVSASGDVNLAVSGAEATVRGGRIHDGRRGVTVGERAHLSLEGVDIVGHSSTGLGLGMGGRVSMKGGSVVKSEETGILLDQAELLLEDGLVEDNRMSGLVVRRGGTATARRTAFHKNRGYGVLVLGGGSVTVEASTLSGNRAGSFHAEGGGLLTRIGNKD